MIATATGAAPATGLTAGGVLFMFLAWGSISILTIWCFYRILLVRGKKK